MVAGGKFQYTSTKIDLRSYVSNDLNIFYSWLNDLPAGTLSHTTTLAQPSIAINRQTLLQDKAFADVTLRCEGQTIECHRAILAEYSPVFKRMFVSELNGNNAQNVFEIESIGFTLLQSVINYFYVGGLTIDAPEVMILLEFADMYDVIPLREACCKMLFKHINTKVAMTIWKYALLYNAPILARQCKQYCCAHFSREGNRQIEITHAFLESEPELVIELLSHPDLQVPNERAAVLCAIIDWLLFDAEKRVAHLERMLEECTHTEQLARRPVKKKIARRLRRTAGLTDVTKSKLQQILFEYSG